MVIKNVTLTVSGDIIALTNAQKTATSHIRLIAFYYELQNDWTAGAIFALYNEGDTPTSASARMFPKTTAGSVGMNLIGLSKRGLDLPASKNLMGYLSAAGTARVTVIFEIV